jgi:hypothetical protein
MKFIALLPMLVAAPALAQSLPPAKPTVAYTIEFTWEKREAGPAENGRRRISVDGEKIRDEAVPARKGDSVDGRVYIADRAAGTLIEFDPADPAKRYKVGPIGETAMPMADGYAPVMKLAGKPVPVGGGSVAGQPCTALAWGAENIGKSDGDRQIWCVAADGIVLSVERRAGLVGIALKAVKLTRQKPDPALFAPPPGFSRSE